MRILFVTDAWHPQVNGVVRTQESVIRELEGMGHEVKVVHPGMFRSIPYPPYPEIRFCILPHRRLKRLIEEHAPDRIHVSTEGPLGLAARRICVRQGIEFTTAYHTHFPKYLREHLRIPEALSWPFLRWFHSRSSRVLSSSETTASILRDHGIVRAVAWTRGIDRSVFLPRDRGMFDSLPRPVLLHAGRLSPEKNVEAFLRLEVEGTKVLVGDGPEGDRLRKRFPDAVFLGWRFGEELARTYSSADVLVFPSLSDTFGMVMIEANSCGTPVAAFPVCGPVDIVRNGRNGHLDPDLRVAIREALLVDRSSCLEDSRRWDWCQAARMLLEDGRGSSIGGS